MGKNKVLLLVNADKDKEFEFSNQVISYLKEKNVEIYAEEEFSKVLGLEAFKNQELSFSIVLGGDGTILNKAHLYKNLDIPFFGINLGRVGCLAESTTGNCFKKLDEILAGNFYVEDRNVMQCKVYQNGKLIHDEEAYNEVVIHRGNLFKMLLITMEVNNHNTTKFYADGVMVATSTGSSAYSLSCGGPLLLPTAKNFVITPVAPQLSTITSLVINDTETVTMWVDNTEGREEYDEYNPKVILDGAVQYDIDGNSVIELTKSPNNLKIMKVNKEASLFEPIYKVALTTQKLFTTE